MAVFDGILLTSLNGLALAAVLFMVAVGLSLVFGTMDVLNLAHGSLALGGAYVGVVFLGTGGGLGQLVLAMIVATIVGLAAGLILSLLTRGIRDHLKQALLTLGLALIAADLMRLAFGGDVKSVAAPSPLDGTIEILGRPYPTYRLFVIAMSLVVGGLLYAVIERSLSGAIVRATVADRVMVEALGIRTKVVLAAVFSIGAALAVVGGLLAAPVLGAQPGLDNTILLLALVVVVIGGLGSIKGAALGAILVGQVQTLGVALLPEFASFLLFGAMAIVLLVRPGGLLPAAHAEVAR